MNKRGIQSPDQLDKEEKQTFENWQIILGKDELNTNDIKEFCKNQINIIESKWKDFETPNNKKSELIPYHTVYKMIISAIESPKTARTALEMQLNQLLNQ